jgi:UDP-galactopyranose mutase
VDHPNITFRPNTDYFELRGERAWRHVIYSGPIDAFFEHRFGALPYRSLHFEHEHLPDTEFAQDVAVYNFPEVDVPYTRITEFKHMTGQSHPGTSLVREYPRAGGEPYYPIPRRENDALCRQYRGLAEHTPDVTFIGRLAEYRYYNMDQVVASALVGAAEALRRL